MNQQQRKYVTQRMHQIVAQRRATIEEQYRNEEQQVQAYVIPQYPSQADILLKLAGFDSPAVLRYQGEELKEAIEASQHHTPRQSSYRPDPLSPGASIFYPVAAGLQTVVFPLNQEELAANEELIAQAVERRKVRLTDRIDALTHAYNRCMDEIMLGEYSHQIQAAISAFENLEV
jgi:hypothetical protein